MRNTPLIIVLSLLGAAYILIYVVNAPHRARIETQAQFSSTTQRHDDFTNSQRQLYQKGISLSETSAAKLFYFNVQNKRLSPEDHTPVLVDIKSDLESLNKAHLAACQNYEVYDRVIKINRILPSRRKPAMNGRSAQTLLAEVARYSGQNLTLSEITHLAETEITALQKEYDILEARIIKADLAPDLETYAALPIHIRKNPARIKSEYEILLTELDSLFEPYFYDYDTPKAGVKINQGTHHWNAVASYQKNQMVLYFNTPAYDAKDYAFLAVHEIMPGHHLDNWAKRKPKICAPYKSYRSRTLLEGWATYAETVADEAGFFDAPDRRLGWLDYRMIRALRILLDIEITTNGDNYEALRTLWETRMPARLHPLFGREYKRLKRAKHHHFSYVLGAQTITKSRRKLETKMGENFDIKEFHDAYLRGNYSDAKIFRDKLEAAMLSLEGQ